MEKTIYLDTLSVDQHQLFIGATQKGLCFVGSDNGPAAEIDKWYPNAQKVYAPLKIEKYAAQLKDYFQGTCQKFDLPIDIEGTALQKAVWQELLTIPFGKTKNYTEIAVALNKHQAVRAVANAIGANPCLVVIPCHRVIRKNGKLSGYRGGLQMKKELLILEGGL